MERISGFYDWICELADSLAVQTDYSQMETLKNMLIVSVIEEARLEKYISGIMESNMDIAMTIIVQDYVYDGFVKSFGDRCTVIPWHGAYNEMIIEKAYEYNQTPFDSFSFFSDFQVNLRDQNFVSIAEKMNDENPIMLFSCTIGNDIFYYPEISKFKKVLSCYENVSDLVSCCLE